MVKREPRPSAVSRVSVPPCAVTIDRAIESPSPAPPLSRSRAASSRTNGSNTRSTSPGGMPGPVSRTLNTPLAFLLEPRAEAFALSPRRPRGAQRALHPALERRQRGAQLGGGVRRKAPHLREGALEPRQHLVQGLGEPIQLVAGSAKLQAAGEVLGGDAPGGARHLVDRLQRLTGDERAAQGRQREPERNQNHQRLGVPRERAMTARERHPDLNELRWPSVAQHRERHET